MRRLHSSQRGSVVLVALCFVAVIGIALAGYLAVANQAMRVSNRSFHSGTAANFAEMGLERALLALNENSWTNWTNLTGGTLGSSADAKLSFSIANTTYGTSGISGTIKVRIYHRNADASWSANPTPAYTTSSMVYHRGVWFQCTSSSPGTSPPHLNTSAWVSAPSVWNPAATYTNYSTTSGDYVIYGSSAYRCKRTHANQLPTNTDFWASVTLADWSNSTTYTAGSLALYKGTAYRCISAHSNQTPPNAAYWVSAPVIYAEGAVTLPDSGKVIRTQLRAEYTPAPLFPNAAAATTAVTFSAASVVDSYDSNLAFPYPAVAAWVAPTAAKPYFVGDFVTSGGNLYRCIAQHTSNFAVSNTTYWTQQGGTWSGSSRIYYLGETVAYPTGTGPIYRCIQQHTSTPLLTPSATSTYWTPNWVAPTASSPYYVGDIVGYLGNFYRCIQQHTTNQTPNASSSAYWAQPLGYSAVVAGGNTSGTAVTLTSGRVNGYVAAPSNTASPYAPRTSVGTSAVVTGSAVSTVTPTTKVDTTRVTRNVYIPQFAINTPSTSGAYSLPSSGELYNAAMTPTRYYYSGNLNITDSRVYTVSGPVQIIVNGYYYQSLNGGSAQIQINNTSTAKLEMFIAGDIALYGFGINNLTHLPKNCVIFSTTTATAPDMSTNTPFCGVIYVPNGSFKVVGAQNLFGAFSAKNLTFSAAAMLHYDTSLRTTVFTGADTPYQITSWRELTLPAEQMTL